MEFKQVAVVGAGQMGSGIAQVLATFGVEVVLIDASSQALDKAFLGIKKSLEKLYQKGKLASGQSPDSVLGRIESGSSFDLVDKCDLAIEAVTENFEIKASVLKALDSKLPKSADIYSNTSSISITRLAATTSRPEQVAGVHFMNPVPLMPLVEIIRGLRTGDGALKKAKAMCEHLGKVWVEARDIPGFVVNRILMPMINEACYGVYEGLAEPEDIDRAMKLGTNQPMGPLALADLIGLDTCLFILNVLEKGLGSKYHPCPLLFKYVEAGFLGRKSGQGFYKY